MIPDKLETDAQSLVLEGDLDSAISKFSTAAQMRAEGGEYELAGWDTFITGGLYRLMAKPEDAAEAYSLAYKHMLMAGSDYGRCKAGVSAVRAYLETGDKATARQFFDAVNGLSIDDVECTIEMALLSLEISENEDISNELLKKGIDAVSKGTAMSPDIKSIFDKLDDMTQEEEVEVLASAPKEMFPLIYQHKAKGYLNRGEYAKAFEAFHLARTYAAENGDLHAFFFSVLGQVMAAFTAQRKHDAIKTMLLGATTLRHYGMNMDANFFIISEGLKAAWGKEEYNRIIDEVMEETRN